MASTEGEEPASWMSTEISLLSSSQKQVRRNALTVILKEVETLPVLEKGRGKGKAEEYEGKDRDSDDDEEEETEVEVKGEETSPAPPLTQVLGIVKPILQHLSDPMEKCRELSYIILTSLFGSNLPSKEVVGFMPLTVPILVERLGQQELIEGSEEVRLIAINFMKSIVHRIQKGIYPFIDDWIRIIAVTVTDPFYEVRKESCEVVTISAKTVPEVFHYNSERLNKPLILCLAHQQSKVRLAGIQSIGDVVLYGNHKVVDDFVIPLTQRLFDQNQNVRKKVVEIVGSWMMDFVDRYSYFHKFLPVVLTGLCDESQQIRETANTLWKRIGDKYLEENLEENRDEADFGIQRPLHYPYTDVTEFGRPNLGCRLLVRRCVGKLIPAVTNDITDWVENTRIKSAQLLSQLILHSEQDVTMHSEPILHCCLKSIMDVNPMVSTNVRKCVRFLAFFAPFDILWDEGVQPRLAENASENLLAVTTEILRGVESEILKPRLAEVVSFISKPEICETMKWRRQLELMTISDAITLRHKMKDFEGGGESHSVIGENIFKILLTMLGMTNTEVKARVLFSFNELRRSCEMEQLEDVFVKYSSSTLQRIQNSALHWTPATPDYMIFSAFLDFGGFAVEFYLPQVLDILKKQLDPGKDAEVRFKLFELLTEILQQRHRRGRTDEGIQVEGFVRTIVEDVLSPNLVWRAGQSASTLRASALACLLTILEQRLLTSTSCEEIVPKILTGCLGLIEDHFDLNRLISVQCIGRLGECCGGKLRIDLIHKVYPELLKRLDDAKEEVRVSAALAISRVFSNVPRESYDSTFFRSHLEYLSKTLLVHLDDDDVNLQAAIAEALRAVGSLSPQIAEGLCEEFKSKHRTPDNCEALLEHFRSLRVQ